MLPLLAFFDVKKLNSAAVILASEDIDVAKIVNGAVARPAILEGRGLVTLHVSQVQIAYICSAISETSCKINSLILVAYQVKLLVVSVEACKVLFSNRSKLELAQFVNFYALIRLRKAWLLED